MSETIKMWEQHASIGEFFQTNTSGKCFVLDYLGVGVVKVEFEDKTVINTKLGDLKRGQCKNPNYPSLLSKGFIGIGHYSPKSHKNIYQTWRSMFVRCYDESYHKTHPEYIGCSVNSEWYSFQKFSEWMCKQKYLKGWQLDKDILFKNNKEYSSNTCCFVPKEINAAFIKQRRNRGDLPIGVTERKVTASGRRFIGQCCLGNGQKYSQVMSSVEDSFMWYKSVKEDYVKSLADKWKSYIDSKVYDALISFEVEIDD